MISENENLITNILPFLEENLKWKRDDMKFETVCSAGRIDVLYRPNNKNTAVLEVKKKGIGRGDAIKQAKRYAVSTKTPIALATDGYSYLETLQIKEGVPLKDFEGKDISFEKKHLLTPNNLIFLKRKTL